MSTCRQGPEFISAMDLETCESSIDNYGNGLQFATGSVRPTLEYLLWIYITKIRAGQLQPSGGPQIFKESPEGRTFV